MKCHIFNSDVVRILGSCLVIKGLLDTYRETIVLYIKGLSNNVLAKLREGGFPLEEERAAFIERKTQEELQKHINQCGCYGKLS